MLELFNDYIEKLEQEVDLQVREDCANQLLAKINDPVEVRTALDHGEPSTLSKLIEVADAQVLKAIVAICDSNDPLLFLKQPGYLILKLITLHTGTNKPEFPGFAEVAKAVYRAEINGTEAKRRYTILVDSYYLGSKSALEAFKKAIDELLTTGTTAQTIAIPERNNAKDMLCRLLDNRCYYSFTRERLKQVIATETDISDEGSFAEHGDTIIQYLETNYLKKKIDDYERFIDIAKSFYTEQPDYSSDVITMDSTWYLTELKESKGSREQKLHYLLHTENLRCWSALYVTFAWARDSIWVPEFQDTKASLYTGCKTMAAFIHQQALKEVDDFGLKSNDEFLAKFKESPKVRFIKEMYKYTYGEDLGMLLTNERVDLLLDPDKARQASNNMMMPGYLPAKLTEMNTGPNKPEFPGFDSVAESVQKGEITEEEAIKRYEKLVRIYYGYGDYSGYLIKVIKELLTTGSTTEKTIVIPKLKEIKGVLCALVDDIYDRSYNREALKQAISRVDLTGKKSFRAQGEVIMAALEPQGYTKANNSTFVERAAALYMEQPIYTAIVKKNINVTRHAILGSTKGTEEEKLHNLLYSQPKLDWMDVSLPYLYIALGYWDQYFENSRGSIYETCATIAEFINQQALVEQALVDCVLKSSTPGENLKIDFIKLMYKAAYGEDLNMVLTGEKVDSILKLTSEAAAGKASSMSYKPQSTAPRNTTTSTSTNNTQTKVEAFPPTTTILEPSPVPIKVAPKEEKPNNGIGLLRILSKVVFACAASQITLMASSKLLETLPNKVLGVLATLPTSVKSYGPLVSPVIICGLAEYNPKIAGISNIVPSFLCLGSAAFSLVSYLKHKEPHHALITLSSVIVTAINYSAAKGQDNQIA